MDLISIAIELHNWIVDEQTKNPRYRDDEIITKKIKIISENLDAVLNEHRLYRATAESKYETL